MDKTLSIVRIQQLSLGDKMLTYICQYFHLLFHFYHQNLRGQTQWVQSLAYDHCDRDRIRNRVPDS